MRIVSWNIRAGGGRRAEGIVEQLRRWQPDVVVLSEFRATPPSCMLADSLLQMGLCFQRSTHDKAHAARNALLVASRWPLRIIRAKNEPQVKHRYLRVNVAAEQPFSVLAVHVPNRITGDKYPFLDALGNMVEHWRSGPALLVGDTNSGRKGIDEESVTFSNEEDGWLRRLHNLQWQDAFRMLYPHRREYTWYSPNGNNGFRFDQAFLHPQLAARLSDVRHEWGTVEGVNRREALSDHAAVIFDFTAL